MRNMMMERRREEAKGGEQDETIPGEGKRGRDLINF